VQIANASPSATGTQSSVFLHRARRSCQPSGFRFLRTLSLCSAERGCCAPQNICATFDSPCYSYEMVSLNYHSIYPPPADPFVKTCTSASRSRSTSTLLGVGILGAEAAAPSPDAPSAGRGFVDGGWRRALCSHEPPGSRVASNLVRTSHRRRRRHRRRVRDHARAVMRAVGRRRGEEARRRMKSRQMVMRAWVAGAVCKEPSVVGRVSGEACTASSGPRRSGTKFRGTDGKEPRGCTATRCSSDSMACFPARPSTSQPSPTRVVDLYPPRPRPGSLSARA
jgi:hypothetical protein